MPYEKNSTLSRSVRLCLLSALACTTACGDDTTQVTGESSSSDGDATTTTETTTTTSNGTTSTTDATTTSAESSTTSSVGDDSSSTTDDSRGDDTGTTTDESTTTGSGEASTTAAGEESTTTGGPALQECPYGTVMAPDVINANTLGEDSEFTTMCGGGGAPDASYTMTAPADGTYFFTASSPDGVVDPIVAVFDGTCGGAQLACNNNIDNFTTDAEVSVALTEGQVVTVVLDGFSLGGGAIDLETTFFAGSCPDGDLGNTVPAQVTGSTVGGDNTVFASCGGNTANDDQYTFTAPQDGVYVFDTAGSDFDTILFLLDGCGGDQLGCNDNVLADNTSHLNLTMTAGQEVVAVVDGAALEEGNYTLSVDRDECPDETLTGDLPITFEGSTLGELDASQGSCGGFGAPDLSFSFTAPEPGVYTIDTVGSDIDTVLYTIDGCGGTEQACNNDGGMGTSSTLNVTLAQDQELFFVVDGADGAAGDIDVNVAFDECPDFDLGQTLPIQVTGNTDFQTDASSGSCGPGNSNDVAYTFTAPEAGTYIFDTNGSDFDTVLYFFEGETCVGTEIECDDDGGDGLDSLLQIPLEADETITVVIDGRFGGSGDYVLNVALPECGNGFVEFGEQCDTDEFGGEDCISQGLGAGDLACDPVTCQIDVSGCGTCGNGTVEGTDVCDGVVLGSQNCTDLGFDGGALDCADDCTYDTAQCADGIIAVCSTPGLAITDGAPAVDTINVPDTGNIADVDVFIDANHSWVSDTEIQLSADDLGVSNEISFGNCGNDDDIFATFNDEGSVAVGANCDEPIGIEGNLTPDQPFTVYDGMEASGDWTLTIADTVGGDDGTLNEWCLYITLEE